MEPLSRLDFQHFSARSSLAYVKSTSAWGTWNSSKEWFQSNFSCGSGLKFNSASATCRWNFVARLLSFWLRLLHSLHLQYFLRRHPPQRAPAMWSTRKAYHASTRLQSQENSMRGLPDGVTVILWLMVWELPFLCAKERSVHHQPEAKQRKCCYLLSSEFLSVFEYFCYSLQFDAKRCKKLLFASHVFGGDRGKVRQRRPSMLCCGNICGAIHLSLG